MSQHRFPTRRHAAATSIPTLAPACLWPADVKPSANQGLPHPGSAKDPARATEWSLIVTASVAKTAPATPVALGWKPLNP